jgi:hypothetical protein
VAPGRLEPCGPVVARARRAGVDVRLRDGNHDVEHGAGMATTGTTYNFQKEGA